MKKYTNISKNQLVFTLRNGRASEEFIVNSGDVVELPSENDYIKSLVSQKFLAEVSAKKKKEEEVIN